MSRIFLHKMPTEKVGQYWRSLEPEIARACAYSAGFLTPEIVKPKALSGEYQVWAAFTDEPRELKAVGVTCLTTLETGEVVAELLLVAGKERRSWLVFDDEMAAWAASNGCRRVLCRGRRGWEHSLPDAWRPIATTYERMIERVEDAA